MGRFAKDKVNFVRSVVLKPTGSTPFGMEDESDTVVDTNPFSKQPNTGRCMVAERGQLTRRRNNGNILSKLKSNLYLKSQRYQIFASPEFKQRLHEETGVPEEGEVTRSPLGLIRSALDPHYRNKNLSIGDLWETQLTYQQETESQHSPSSDSSLNDESDKENHSNADGRTGRVRNASDVRRMLIKEAKLGYKRDMKQGRFSMGSSKLSKHVVTAVPTHPPAPRRSARIASKTNKKR